MKRTWMEVTREASGTKVLVNLARYSVITPTDQGCLLWHCRGGSEEIGLTIREKYSHMVSLLTPDTK